MYHSFGSIILSFRCWQSLSYLDLLFMSRAATSCYLLTTLSSYHIQMQTQKEEVLIRPTIDQNILPSCGRLVSNDWKSRKALSPCMSTVSARISYTTKYARLLLVKQVVNMNFCY